VTSMTKIEYLLKSVSKRLANKKSLCPNCNAPEKNARQIDAKFLVTKLVECQSCNLLYRTPTDSREEAHDFYQEEYSQGYTTDAPDEAELKKLLAINFKDTERDYSRYIQLFNALGVRSNAKILDFGCSWGYGTYQFKKAGYEAIGYEVSEPRCDYARKKLNVQAVSTYDKVGAGCDVFFSSHVLEHVDSVKDVWMLAKKTLKPGGLFIAYTPNGSKAYREANFAGFHKSWGLKHPNLLQDIFIKNLSEGAPFFVGSSPHRLNEIRQWDKSKPLLSDCSGWEFLAIIVK
jgi:2-polyprenyl-3-methyl-5-hydroxy-6-metoxy-1,4-benzoquinol methylase